MSGSQLPPARSRALNTFLELMDPPRFRKPPDDHRPINPGRLELGRARSGTSISGTFSAVKPEAERMAEIVAEQAAMLKRAEFRKRRHSFNRTASDGIVHVVSFWQAPKEPPAWTEVPGLRERRYGSFRVDFGVYVPEMTRMGSPQSSWINEYNCHLRRTMGQLIAPHAAGDLWWKLDNPSSSTDTYSVLVDHGLPWLERFSNREAVLGAFDRQGPLPLGMSPAGPLDIADLYRAMEQRSDEDRVLRRYVENPVLETHALYLRDYLVRTGHGDLATRVETRSTLDS